jgi:beta-1,4-mannosyl-glycoprotein beta-1,4-N-acetylglucosaminyltransferase
MAIIDCFMFWQELELLDIRLNYLDPIIDRFVLVEAKKDHAGNDKPLYYDENKQQFKKFFSKIVHVIVNDMPTGSDRWERENHQRNCINTGLSSMKLEDEDYILVGDMDEIPKLDLVANKFFGTYYQRCFMYYLNVAIPEPWPGTVGLSYREYKNSGNPQALRNKRQSLEPIRNGGWHFAWLGGYERVKQKILSFAHDEIGTPDIMNNLKHSVENVIPLWCPNGGPLQSIPIGELELDYITDNAEKFEDLIYGKS